MENNDIKLIIYDLDGVLCDCRDLHYEALNYALGAANPKYVISREDHLSKFDGLNTKAKLNILKKERGLSDTDINIVFTLKQKYTLDLIENMNEDWRMRSVLRELKERNLKIAVCSNSIRQTVKMILVRTGLIDFIDFYFSNEDVKNPKPSSEIYLKAMLKAGVSPNETLIVEDSPTGRKAASNSGATVMGVYSTNEVTIENINKHLNMQEKETRWSDPNLTVLIPCAGLGSRFAAAGYSFPKPLIEVGPDRKSMIQLVIENLGFVDCHYVFVVQKEHYLKYNLATFLKLIAGNNTDIVIVDGLTDGAACSVLLAKDFINNDKPLLIANSDQYIEDWNSPDFMWSMNSDNIDAGVVLFKATHPKYSYTKIEDNGFISQIKEKSVISENATVGIYYWKKGSDCVSSIEEMISKNDRTLGEFYLAPSMNILINNNKNIKPYWVDKMWGIGDPEGLQYFIENCKIK